MKSHWTSRLAFADKSQSLVGKRYLICIANSKLLLNLGGSRSCAGTIMQADKICYYYEISILIAFQAQKPQVSHLITTYTASPDTMVQLSTIVLSVQGVLMTAVGLFALLDPESFVAGTSDHIEGKPTQLLHSLRCVVKYYSPLCAKCLQSYWR